MPARKRTLTVNTPTKSKRGCGCGSRKKRASQGCGVARRSRRRSYKKHHGPMRGGQGCRKPQRGGTGCAYRKPMKGGYQRNLMKILLYLIQMVVVKSLKFLIKQINI